MFRKALKVALPLVLFLILYYSFVALTFKHYGITWDENDVYTGGYSAMGHLLIPGAPMDPGLVSKVPGAEIKSVYNHTYSIILNIINRSHSYAGYHLLNMLFGSLAFIVSYFMFFKRYKSGVLALAGPVFLIFTARFVGDFPANPKDMPFAVMYLIALSSIYFFASYENVLIRILIFGCVFGLLGCFRILGFGVFGVLFLYDVHIFIEQYKKSLSFKKIFIFLRDEILYLALIMCVALLMLVITWPYIGSSFFKHFIDIAETSKNYPWFGVIHFAGTYVKSHDLPWNYLPQWIVVTTPIAILCLFAAGVFNAFRTNFKNPIYFLMMTALIINFSIYYISKPVIYDGLRHFMFVLPMIATIAAACFIEFSQSRKKWFGWLIIALVVFNFSTVTLNYIQLHPYEYIYYNELVGGLPHASKDYEIDYWGASFREANLWLRDRLKDDPKTHRVYTCAHPFISTYYFGPNMTWTDKPENADFGICYVRRNEDTKVPGKVIYTVERQGVALNYVKKVIQKD